ncbi:MAG: endonuclease III [Candidatus Paceibacterota bacterium]
MQNQRQTIKKIISILEKEYPNPKTALYFKTPHQLLVATILSAQCTDRRVNIVTENLFKKYKNVKDFANADLKEFESDIHSTGFYRNKAKNIIAASKMISSRFNGKVPDDMDKLITLPGVARKTANVVLFEGFGENEGIAVDTHVKRLSNLLKITKNDDPKKIEKDLMENTARENWGKFSNLLILHGRNTCVARKPKCENCKLNKICPSDSGLKD